MAQALVPMKDLVKAKSRLSGLLCPSERRALAQAMAEDVLGVLSRHSAITQITLVSDDPGAGLLAQRYGAQCWSEASLAVHGLNTLIQRASERLCAGRDTPLLVLHADLPLLAEDDISAVLTSQHALQGLIIGCDRRGSGTNLLAFSATAMPRFCFGSDSCKQHLASARSCAIPAQILQRPGIGVDVDEAADLQYVMQRLQHNSTGNTARLLHNTELGARVTLALSTLGNELKSGDDFYTGIVN